MFRIAFKFLIYDKPKSIGALAGIIISVFLIGQQTGIFIFLTDSMANAIRHTQTDLWIVDNKTTNVNALTPIDMRIGRQIESIPGVKKVSPIVMTGGSAKFSNGTSAAIMLVGSQSPDFIGGPINIISGNINELINEGAVTTDYFDSKLLGNSTLGDNFEIAGKKVYVAAQTEGTRGFGLVNVFTTIERARYLGKVPNNKASAFLVELMPGTDSITIQKMINDNIVGAKAWLPTDFAFETKMTILKSTGIAVSIGTLVIFAIISGFVIIGLTLYSAAIDRIKDYGTMKAIGATNNYIRNLILMQAMIFAIIGFVLSMLLLALFQKGVANSGVFFQYPWWLRLAFFIITAFISLGGAFFAIRKISILEPASVFRG